MSRFQKLLRWVGCLAALGCAAGCSRSTPKSDAPPIVTAPAASAAVLAKAEAGAPAPASAKAKAPRPKMRPASGAIAVAALRAAPHAPVPQDAPASGFRLSYAPTEDAVAQAFQRAFQQERVLEGVVAQLNASLRIRGSIEIELAGCGEANAFYDDGRGDTEPAEGDRAAAPPSAPTSPRITL